MRIVAFITERVVIDRILLHLARNRPAAARGPPTPVTTVRSLGRRSSQPA
jgi:hypothetical protein